MLIVVESKFPVALRVRLAVRVSIVFTIFSGVTSIVMPMIVALSIHSAVNVISEVIGVLKSKGEPL